MEVSNYADKAMSYRQCDGVSDKMTLECCNEGTKI